MSIFDKMKVSVTDMTEQQRYTSSIREISGRITGYEAQISDLTRQIGVKYVQEHLNEPGAEFADILTAIQNLKSQIASSEALIERLKAQQIAEEGERQQALQKKEDADRTAHEQARLAREAQRASMRQQRHGTPTQYAQYSANSNRIIYCNECGRPNDIDAEFCVYCGYSLKGDGSGASIGTAETTQVEEAVRESVPSVGIVYCGECGKPNDADAEFCVYCGHPLKKPGSGQPFEAAQAAPVEAAIKNPATVKTSGAEKEAHLYDATGPETLTVSRDDENEN